MSLRWIHDVFGNSVAIATFDERAEALSFDSTATVEHNPAEEFALTPDDPAYFYPFPLRRRGVSRPSFKSSRRNTAIRTASPFRMGPEFSRCGRADPDLQYSERYDPRHPRDVHLPQAP